MHRTPRISSIAFWTTVTVLKNLWQTPVAYLWLEWLNKSTWKPQGHNWNLASFFVNTPEQLGQTCAFHKNTTQNIRCIRERSNFGVRAKIIAVLWKSKIRQQKQRQLELYKHVKNLSRKVVIDNEYCYYSLFSSAILTIYSVTIQFTFFTHILKNYTCDYQTISSIWFTPYSIDQICTLSFWASCRIHRSHAITFFLSAMFL